MEYLDSCFVMFFNSIEHGPMMIRADRDEQDATVRQPSLPIGIHSTLKLQGCKHLTLTSHYNHAAKEYTFNDRS